MCTYVWIRLPLFTCAVHPGAVLNPLLMLASRQLSEAGTGHSREEEADSRGLGRLPGVTRLVSSRAGTESSASLLQGLGSTPSEPSAFPGPGGPRHDRPLFQAPRAGTGLDSLWGQPVWLSPCSFSKPALFPSYSQMLPKRTRSAVYGAQGLT